MSRWDVVGKPGFQLSSTVGRISSSAIRDLLTIAERPEVVNLAGGFPAPEAFPTVEVGQAVARLLAGGPDVLQYSTTQGYEPLRAWAGARHGAPPDRVVITSGSQQGLDLVARALVEPGAEVALADPGYIGAVQAFKLAGARLLPVPSDGDGMQVDVLSARLADGHRPAVVYVVPNFDNPTGTTLTAERRHALAGLADRYGFVVVEDDPYGELRFAGTGPPPVASFTDRVVSLGTVSKIVCPGLRVGYLVGPAPVSAAVVLLKQAVDLQTSILAQRVVHAVVTAPGFLAAHLARLRALYHERAVALVTALQHELGPELRVALPAGGMFVWARLAQSPVGPDLLPAALAEGVAFVPGSAFSVSARHDDALRLAFGAVGPYELVEGARRLRRALLAVTAPA